MCPVGVFGCGITRQGVKLAIDYYPWERIGGSYCTWGHNMQLCYAYV